MKITLENADFLDQAEEKIQLGVLIGLQDVEEHIINEALPITPKLTSDLALSVDSNINQTSSNTNELVVSFGNSEVDYAWEQEHGDKMGYVNYTTPGTGPRFLSGALNTVRPFTPRLIGRRIWEVLKI
jgi:hypothetical protein